MRLWRIERDKLGDILKEIHDAMSSTKEYSTKKGMIMDHLGALYEDFIHPIADLLEPMCPENKLVFIGNEVRVSSYATTGLVNSLFSKSYARSCKYI